MMKIANKRPCETTVVSKLELVNENTGIAIRPKTKYVFFPSEKQSIVFINSAKIIAKITRPNSPILAKASPHKLQFAFIVAFPK